MRRQGKINSGRKGLVASVVATALLSSVLVVAAGQPAGAATSTDVTASCSSNDPTAQGLLNSFLGGAVTAPLTATVDAPASVEPGQTDVPVGVTWSLNLAPALVDKAAAVTDHIDMSDAHLDTKVSGPTSTTGIPGSPPNQTIKLVKGQPFSASFGPFPGQLKDIGSAGIIVFSVAQISFTMALTVSGKAVSLPMQCDVNATIGTVPVKVAGSPDIATIPNIDAKPNEKVTVDVLGKYVTAGKDKAGTVHQVQPDTLKVVSGAGAIEGGKVVVTAPASGSSSATFEVCAGKVQVAEAFPGATETQQLTIPNSPEPLGLALKRPIGFTLSFDGKVTQPIWTALNPLFHNRLAGPKPANWRDAWSQAEFLLSEFAYPEAADIQAALTALPNVGPGGVEVSVNKAASDGTKQVYDIKFAGPLANKNVPAIVVPEGDFMSILPHEFLGDITAAAQALLNKPSTPPDPKDPKTVPPGMTADQYIAKLVADSDAALAAGNFQAFIDLRGTALAVQINSALGNIDVGAAINFLTSLFAGMPGVKTTAAGEDPRAAQVQELCSQGVITVRVASASVEGTTTTAPGGGGSGSGSSSVKGAAIAITG